MNFFEKQLLLLKNAVTSNTYVMGDFNLDARMIMRHDYHYKIPLKALADLALELNLDQVINFNTWSRAINGVKKESCLDHVYANNAATITNVYLKHLLLVTTS